MKIVTAPTRLTPRARLVHDAELKIRRVYDLGAILTLRQRRSVVESLLIGLLQDYDKLPAKEHGGKFVKYKEATDAVPAS